MGKKAILVLIVLLVASLLACAQQPPAPAAPSTTSGPKPTATQAASAKPSPVPGAATVPQFRLAAATPETGSTAHILGSMIAALVSQKTDGRIRLAVIPTSGTVDGIDRLRHKEVDLMTSATPSSMYLSARSKAEYTGQPPIQLYSLFPQTLSIFHTLLHANSPIEKWPDLVGKKMQLGTPGSVGAVAFNDFLEQTALKGKVDTVSLSFDAGISALTDRKIDIACMQTGIPNALITEFATRNPMKFLDFTKEMVDKRNQLGYEGMAIYSLSRVPKTAYPNMLRDAYLCSVLQLWCTSKDMPEDAAYWLVKTVWENVEEVRKLNTALAFMTNETLKQIPQDISPFHPGALRYYKEKGIL